MAQRRLAALQAHLQGTAGGGGSGGSSLQQAPCAAPTAIRQLPRFDTTIMESFLDSHRQLKLEAYELFRQVGAPPKPAYFALLCCLLSLAF